MSKKPTLQEEIAMAEADRRDALHFKHAKTPSLRAAMVAAAQDVAVNAKAGITLAMRILNHDAALKVRRMGAA